MSQQGDPGFTFASLMILAALGLFAWGSSPLESARPPSEEKETTARRTDDQVPARLWQDPFDAIRRQGLLARDGTADSTGGLSLPKRVSAAVTALKDKDDQLTVLLATLTPGSYAELEERRRRRRYAILSALSASNYAPESAETLGLYRVETPKDASRDEKRRESGTEEYALTQVPDVTVPYEWYEYEDPGTGEAADGSVLVLWLDDSWLGDDPFQRLLHLVRDIHQLADHSEGLPVRWVMIGPSGSGTLRAMVAGRDHASGFHTLTGLRAFHILSPAATVDDSDLDPGLARCPQCGSSIDVGSAAPSRLLGTPFSDSPCAGGSDEQEVAQTCMRFLRTIRSDADLIDALAEELRERRGVGRGDTVLVLSEWDTYFGRSLPRALEKALNPGEPSIHLQHYTYERGIDGIAYGETATPPPDTPSKKDAPAPRGESRIRRPFGTGQFDYLRRLARVIREEDRRLREDHGRGIKAVAVLGSDVYDKLLILRALRDRLPGAVWITTDLDANLLHPDEFAWARNLIVASTFDLALPRSSQGESPPFRDSYQTSAYLATLIALKKLGASSPGADSSPEPADDLLCEHAGTRAAGEPFCGQGAMYARLPPILFEVGRHGAVRLLDPAASAQAGSAPHPALTHVGRRSLAPYFVGGVLIAGLGLFMLHQIRRRSGRIVLGLGALLLLVAGLSLVASGTADGGEPLQLRDGASLWPTIGIRILTVGLTGVFVFSLVRRLDRGWQDLNHLHFGGEEVDPDRGLTLREAWTALTSGLPLRAWALWCLGLLALVVVAMYRVRTLDAPLLRLVVVQAAVFGVLIGGWWALMYRGARLGFHVKSISEWLEAPSGGSAIEMWRSYRAYGSAQNRILRSAGTGLVYLAFGSTVFALLGGTTAPARGEVARILHGLSIGVGVPLMIFLLFLLVDAIRLCIGWIEKLQDPRLDWSGAEIQEIADRQRLPVTHAAYWLQVHLIGERTGEMSRLIYYPLVVILLMLLARSTYFDDFDFPMALAIIVGLNFAIVVVAAAALNSTARRAREKILERLREERLRLEKDRQPAALSATPAQIEELADKLAKLNVGAYQRFWDQPLARATVLLMTGFALAYTEYGWLLR